MSERRNWTHETRTHRRVLFGGIAAAGLILSAGGAHAGALVLEDGNASVTYQSDGLGLTSWEIDGVNHLGLQGFWFFGLGSNFEVPLSQLGLLGVSTTNTDPNIPGVTDPRDDTLVAVYGDASTLTVTVRLSLDGGLPGSGAADLAEQISIDNRGDATRRFSFYQYVDFNLSGDGSDDSVQLLTSNTVLQGDTFTSVAETVVTPTATRAELGVVPQTFDKLQDNVADDLAILLNPIQQFTPLQNASGDVSWAFQWDVELAPGQTFQISKDKRLEVVPEPASALMLAGALAALSRTRRRRPGA